jgi:hypothetical protein
MMAEGVFHCPLCSRPLPLSPEMAGQEITCPACEYLLLVPKSFTELTPPPSPPTINPDAPRRWWVRFPSGRANGPVAREVVEGWIRDGRAGPGSLVALEGANAWSAIEKEFEDLCAKHFVPRSRRQIPYAPRRNPLAGLPAARLLEAVPNYRQALPGELRRKHVAIDDRIARECARSTAGVELIGTRSLVLSEISPTMRHPPSRLVAENVVMAALRSKDQEFYLTLPWGPLGQMPHEFFSILPGKFPSALALRRKGEENSDDPVWLDGSGRTDTPLTRAARDASPALAADVNWRWISESGGYEMVLVWSLQCVPLGARQWLHLMATACQGALRRTFGIDWYLQRQQAALQFRDGIAPAGDHEPHLLFGSVTGRVLCRLLEW